MKLQLDPKSLTVYSFPLIFLLLLSCRQENVSEVYKPAGIAINGYDPVAYFTDSMPVLGNEEFTFTWKDADWRFASRQHLDLFRSDPEKYSPQFGGYCAYGMFEGHKATTEPGTWTIVDGKLYLNYNMNVRDLWRGDIPGHIRIANENWPEVKKEKF
jgi:hypothetical protein